MPNPMLSIIIPIYKTEKFLRRCIDSVLAQSIQDYEIILVDDGSPDQSPVICDEYTQKDSRIKVIHKKNQGLGMARNSGMQLASGKYLTFLDSDDFVEKEYYGDLLSFSIQNNLDVCVAGYYWADTGQTQKKTSTVDKKMTGKIITIQKQIDALSSKVICPDLDGKDFFSASVCFAIFRSEILMKNNLLFDSEKNFLSEDMKFTMTLFHYCQKVGVSEKGGYHYWYNENSLSRGYNPDRFEALKRTMEQLEELCVELELDDYIDRSALYFWINFQKCLNQEIRYSKKNRYVQALDLKNLCEDAATQERLRIFENKGGLKKLQKILYMLILKKRYFSIVFLLRLYNLIKH